jgi:hypothetical protein
MNLATTSQLEKTICNAVLAREVVIQLDDTETLTLSRGREITVNPDTHRIELPEYTIQLDSADYSLFT